MSIICLEVRHTTLTSFPLILSGESCTYVVAFSSCELLEFPVPSLQEKHSNLRETASLMLSRNLDVWTQTDNYAERPGIPGSITCRRLPSSDHDTKQRVSRGSELRDPCLRVNRLCSNGVTSLFSALIFQHASFLHHEIDAGCRTLHSFILSICHKKRAVLSSLMSVCLPSYFVAARS